MDVAINFTAYDFVVLGVFALLIGRGIWLGFLRQVTGLIALYLGYLVASQYNDRFFPFLKNISENPKIVFLASYAILFCATYIVAMFLGKFLSSAVKVTLAGWFDRLVGAVLGFLKALILVVLMHMILGAALAPENAMLQSCQTCSTLNGAVNLSLDLIRNEEVRKSLMQQKPAISMNTVKKYFSPEKKPTEPVKK
jgi:membrane protein required for colicin V production